MLLHHLPKVAFVCAVVMASAAANAAETNYRAWIDANGGTPSVYAGIEDVNIPVGYDPGYAFDGVIVSSEPKEKYLGGKNSATDAYIVYGADIAGKSFTLRRYRICQSTIGNYSNARAPSAWTLYGADSPNAADDEWTLVDSRSGVVWSGTSFAQNAAIPGGIDRWRTFMPPKPATFKYYKIAFSAAADLSSTLQT